MRRSVLLLLLVCGAAGCVTEPVSRTDSAPGGAGTVVAHAASGDTLRLRPGESARVGDGGVHVLFREVSSDSRCPSELTCVWAGDAVAEVEVIAPDHRPLAAALHTGVDPREVRVHGHRIQLLGVEPYPGRAGGIDPGSYVAVIRVTRH